VGFCCGGGIVNMLATCVPELAAGVRFSAVKYSGTQPSFNNDTIPRHDAKAADEAWTRTLALFKRTLR